ncbi:hypothetical protein C8F04DRAFT_1271091 [Mycena alexandri]|uniref:Uncharacterized protein n=1 Tax=Mycena alexandri TaxID=1745969 RepID=A0AAD6SA37_9AGAR|nr:hypothetical protein C8F04DRAFT_1271091 [Mycena alexandri]
MSFTFAHVLHVGACPSRFLAPFAAIAKPSRLRMSFTLVHVLRVRACPSRFLAPFAAMAKPSRLRMSFTLSSTLCGHCQTFRFHNNRPSLALPYRVCIVFVSSYGNLTKDGAPDLFEYGLPMPSLRERPSSEEDLSISMSINVDNMFAFLGRDPQRRQRVASDASSFYFKAPSEPSARGHRRCESNMSVSAQGPAP